MHHQSLGDLPEDVGKPYLTWQELRSKGRVVERDGAVWFVTGADKDEVLFKRDGEPTYFASDILYHRDKLERRGFQRSIDVWGDVGSSLALMRALKQQLDPKNTLNPGRYVGGI